ncbi:YidC/Oxa1 family membrane protein insertase [Candidatus Peregrinibacteria bacterium]|nr:YidC/Oxa1 family membrane protein insertase [Candidatus Peregrinibacteria bacterium]
MKKNDIIFYIFIFFATFLVMQYFRGGTTPDPALTEQEIGMKMTKSEYAVGKPIILEIKNNGTETIVIPSECPDAPLTIYKFGKDAYEEVKPTIDLNCDNAKDTVIEAGEKKTIAYNDYLFSVFGNVGRYKIEYGTGGAFATPEFQITEPGIFTATWRTLVYRPMLNLLIAILTFTPGHNLGLGVIILTVLIRTILLLPSQKSMLAQRRMQLLQPKLEELKKKHAGDQQRLAQETMLLWKTHKVNPLSSCLPLLIQMPILIGLYNVVQSGLNPDRAFFIYGFMPEFTLADISNSFLGYNLLDKSLILFPVAVGGLQFLQMKLMMAKQKDKPQKNEMAMANNMMTYFMPIMIAVFTASTPAAVGLYWGTSTLYGIFQQLVVNKESTITPSNEDDVKIRIINKNT